jgi:hypothetical protein
MISLYDNTYFTVYFRKPMQDIHVNLDESFLPDLSRAGLAKLTVLREQRSV